MGGEHVTAAKPGDAGALPCWGSWRGGWRWGSPTSPRPRSAVMVYGGGLVETVTLVLDKVRPPRRPARGPACRPEVKIVPALLGELAGAIGAALVARAGDRYRVDVA